MSREQQTPAPSRILLTPGRAPMSSNIPAADGGREYEYDPLMRITRLTAKDPDKNIVLDSSYTYDSMDNILSKQTGQGRYNDTGACPELVEGMPCLA